jgi:hypothetical protein
MRFLSLLILLSACTTGASVEDGSSTDEDVGTDTGTSGTDTGGADTGNTDTSEPEYGPSFTFEANYDLEPASNWRLGTWLVHFDNDGFVYVRDYGEGAAVRAWPASFDVASPRGADVIPNGDGTNGAYWFVYLYADANDNGAWDSGEGFQAVAPRMLAYVDTFQGFPDVFYGLAFTETGDLEFFDAAEGFDLVTVAGADSITLDGTVATTGNPNSAPDRIATFSFDEFDGTTVVPGRPLDEALATPFSVTINGAPAAERQVEDEGFIYAIETPYAYTDSDTSGGYTAGDELVAGLCAGTDPVYLFWTPPATDIEGASIAALYDFSSGLVAYASRATGEEALTDTTGLVVSSTLCSF